MVGRRLKWDEQRELARSQTAFLVIEADLLGLASMTALLAFSWSTVVDGLSGGWLACCCVGVGLIAARVIYLCAVNLVPQRLSDRDLEAWGSPSGQHDQRHRRNREAEDVIRRHYQSYCSMLAVGIVGYWLLTTATGGPFESPLAPLALGSIFLGQVRAGTRRALWRLLAGVIAAVLASALVTDGLFGLLDTTKVDGLDFSTTAFVLPWLVVALMTSWVNDTTLFVVTTPPPGDAGSTQTDDGGPHEQPA